ncbi:TRAP transporter small permease [Treponema parvum]|uniref:TRAP transporter small permease n=1 Tax=Treponema parvum TaxID=138851 RepID=A0A975F454_9SPIR|nr:TRAP transporter small permease [Treponema parvum]QTQ14284.1 TRAP transporter small permease [Treponema parvum]
MSGKFKTWKEDNKLVRSQSGFKETIILVNHWSHKIILTIAQTAEIAMLAILFMNVVLRYVFNTGVGWAEEVPRLMVILFSFIACAVGVRDHMHVSVTVIYSHIKNRHVKKALDILSDVATLICGLILVIYGYKYVQKLTMVTGKLPMTGLPTWVQYLPAPMAGFLMTFDSILFLTGILKADDLLYSTKEIDYVELVKERDIAKEESRCQ